MASPTNSQEIRTVLLTGTNGFTGHYLLAHLQEQGLSVHPLTSDLCAKAEVTAEVKRINPDAVIHLAGISFAGKDYGEKIYHVNCIGTENLLSALTQTHCRKVILASSASVYGENARGIVGEDTVALPQSHYAISKYAMERMASNYRQQFDIIMTRPFNYTGPGHADHFLIPKIVAAFAERQDILELGNLNVYREFNDVRDVVKVYRKLLHGPPTEGETVVNICSGQKYNIQNILDILTELSGHKITVQVNPAFVRKDDPEELIGDHTRLQKITQYEFQYTLRETLSWMYTKKREA